LLFKPVYGDGFARASQPEDFFSCDNLSLNNISLLGHKEQEGRNLMLNWEKRLTSKTQRNEPMSTPNDLVVVTA